MMRYDGVWYESPEDWTYGRWMQEPYGNVFIGCDPSNGMTPKTIETFDAFVNVADTPCETLDPYPHKKQTYLWYPVNEIGYWGLGVFYWTNTVMDKLMAEKKVVYHHCHAGAHRSPVTFFVYLLYKGMTMTEAAKIIDRRSPQMEICRFFMDVKNGHISPYLFAFLEAQRRHPTYSFMGLLQYMRRDTWPQHDARTLDPEIISTRCPPQYEREETIFGKGIDMKAAYLIMEPFLDEEAKEYVRDYKEQGDFSGTIDDLITLEHVTKKPV